VVSRPKGARVKSEGHLNNGICFSRDRGLFHDGDEDLSCDKVLDTKSGGILVNYVTGVLFEV
jgi:hypothetical protein